jgi:hypothetical protein
MIEFKPKGGLKKVTIHWHLLRSQIPDPRSGWEQKVVPAGVPELEML